MKPNSFFFRVDHEDRVVDIGHNWSADDPATAWNVLAEYRAVVGESLWDCVKGATSQAIWQGLFQRARESGATLYVPFRCDTRAHRQHFEIQLSPLPARHVKVISALVIKIRRLAPIEDGPIRFAEVGLTTCCAWCGRFQASDGQWWELEDAVHLLRLLERDGLPAVSHGICESCLEQYHL